MSENLTNRIREFVVKQLGNNRTEKGVAAHILLDKTQLEFKSDEVNPKTVEKLLDKVLTQLIKDHIVERVPLACFRLIRSN